MSQLACNLQLLHCNFSGSQDTNDESSADDDGMVVGENGGNGESSSGILAQLRANRAQLLDDFANGHSANTDEEEPDGDKAEPAAEAEGGEKSDDATSVVSNGQNTAQPGDNNDDYVVLSD